MRAQVTLFIIIGLIILLSAGLMLFLKGMLWDKPPELDTRDQKQVTDYIEGCLAQAADKSIREFGLAGGEPSPWSISMGGAPVYYGQWEGMNLIPPADKASIYLAGMICEEFSECADLSSLKGLQIIPQGQARCEVILSIGKTTARLDYPLEIRRAAALTTIREYETTIDADVKTALLCASEIVSTAIANDGYLDPRMMDYSCGLVRACHENGIVKVFKYQSLDMPPSFTFRFATDDDLLKGCTIMREDACI